MLALSSLHPGVGRSEAAHVDLPVQRDELDFPTIWASSLKGAIRSRAEPAGCDVDKRAKAAAVFGPRPEAASEHSASAAFLDARLVAIPARSLRGVWLYVTSPLLLSRAAAYFHSLGLDPGPLRQALEFAGDVRPGEAAVSGPQYLEGKSVVINEVELQARSDSAPVPDIPPVRRARELLGRVGFAYVSDDDIQLLVRRSLLVQYRVRLKAETKTVDVGPWSEEYIPPFTIFLSGVYCRTPPARVRVVCPSAAGNPPPNCTEQKLPTGGVAYECQLSGLDVCQYLAQAASGPVWLGGKETIGKGLAELIW